MGLDIKLLFKWLLLFEAETSTEIKINVGVEKI